MHGACQLGIGGIIGKGAFRVLYKFHTRKDAHYVPWGRKVEDLILLYIINNNNNKAKLKNKIK